MATDTALKPIRDISQPLLDSLPDPLEPLHKAEDYRIMHMSVSPDNRILAIILSPVFLISQILDEHRKRLHEDYIALYHLDCRAIFKHLIPPVNEGALESDGASASSMSIYYCTFLADTLLLVGWEANIWQQSTHYLHLVDIDSGTWELMCNPCLMPICAYGRRSPHLYRQDDWLYMLSQESPWDLARFTLYCFSLPGRKMSWRKVMYLSEIDPVLESVYPNFAVHHDCVFILTVFDKVFRYDMTTWELHMEFPTPDPEYGYPEQRDPKYRRHYGFSGLGENMYIAGGYITKYFTDMITERKELRQDMWQLNLDSLSWSKYSASLPHGHLVSCLCLYAPESPMSSSVIEFFFGSWKSVLPVWTLQPGVRPVRTSQPGNSRNDRNTSYCSTMSSNLVPSNRLFSWEFGLLPLQLLAWRVIRVSLAQGILHGPANSPVLPYLPWSYRKRLPTVEEAALESTSASAGKNGTLTNEKSSKRSKIHKFMKKYSGKLRAFSPHSISF